MVEPDPDKERSVLVVIPVEHLKELVTKEVITAMEADEKLLAEHNYNGLLVCKGYTASLTWVLKLLDKLQDEGERTYNQNGK